MRSRCAVGLAAVLTVALAGSGATMQTHGEPERFVAFAVVNNVVASGAGTVEISIDRWSTDAERQAFVTELQEGDTDSLLEVLTDLRSVGRIRTPDALGYEIRYAQQTAGEDGGRQIVLATDRPIGFWEAVHQPRTIDYPFTVIEMRLGPDGTGEGTLSYATRVVAHENGTIVLEDYANQPVMLTAIEAEPQDAG